MHWGRSYERNYNKPLWSLSKASFIKETPTSWFFLSASSTCYFALLVSRKIDIRRDRGIKMTLADPVSVVNTPAWGTPAHGREGGSVQPEGTLREIKSNIKYSRSWIKVKTSQVFVWTLNQTKIFNIETSIYQKGNP